MAQQIVRPTAEGTTHKFGKSSLPRPVQVCDDGSTNG